MSKRIGLFALSILATGMAASQPAPPTQGQAVAAQPLPTPTRGVESKRWEPWSAMRTAADQIVGWKIGVRSDAFPGATFAEALEKTDSLSLSNIEAFSNQKLSIEVPKALDNTLYDDEMR